MKELVLKLIRMRKAMLHKDVCLKNKQRTIRAIHTFQTYAEFFPNATDKGYKAMVNKNLEDFHYLMPGRSHSAYAQIQQELFTHLN